MQSSVSIRLGIATVALLLSVRVGAAQDTLDAARGLYSAAAYEDALAVLDRLSASADSVPDRFAINQYRAFAFLALGRTTEAERAIETLVSDKPLYQPTDAEASPRLRSAFSTVRQRMLPAVVQQRYTLARAAFDRKDYAAAEAGFVEVLTALADPDLGPAATRPPLSELGTLAADFKELSTRASAQAAEAAAAASAIAAAEAARVAEAERAVAARAAARAAVSAPPRIFSLADSAVAPPVTIRQNLPPFSRNYGVMLRGVLELVIDETGRVEDANMSVPANPRYDPLVLDAAKDWKYRPATLDGVPVKFRRSISLTLKPDAE